MGLFAGCEFRAAFAAGEHFVWVAALGGVKGAAQHFHCGEVILRKLLGHKIDFLRADTMFAGDTAAERDALF